LFSPVTPPPVWLGWAIFAGFLGPHLLCVLAGREHWVRFAAYFQIGVLALVLVKNLIFPVPVFATFAPIYFGVCVLLVLLVAAASRLLARLIAHHVWRRGPMQL
jgi:hypothetical protein